MTGFILYSQSFMYFLLIGTSVHITLKKKRPLSLTVDEVIGTQAQIANAADVPLITLLLLLELRVIDIVRQDRYVEVNAGTTFSVKRVHKTPYMYSYLPNCFINSKL
jgi:hypothetical protein